MANGLKTANIIDPNDDTRFVAVDPYVIEGVPRVLASLDDSAGSAFKSTDVSSVDDNGSGSVDVNLTNAFDSSDYPIAVSNQTNTNAVQASFFSSSEINTTYTDSDDRSVQSSGLLA